MEQTPKGNRLHIALFGRTNVGKSSLLNFLVGQDIAITSPIAGTTTDVVEKAAELLPLGPVLFLDTAGLDDASMLAGLRMEKTNKIFDRAEVILLVTEPGVWTGYEDAVVTESRRRGLPTLAIVNKIDTGKPASDFLEKVAAKAGRVLSLSSIDPENRDAYLELLKKELQAIAPGDRIRNPSLIGDLLPAGGIAVLVVPIDLQAPKGRLILPQVQTIRDALDHDATVVVVKERELAAVLARLGGVPDIVVCDSQAVLKVTADVPREVPCTTFSILFARQKGDLAAAAAGAAALEGLRPGDRVLIAEACSHHALQDDIGRVKIPRWIRQFVGGEIQADVCSGRDYPGNLRDYKLVIHCGGCMLTRREMLSRIEKAREAGVPVTNYGVAISLLQGVIQRTLAPFPAARMAYEKNRR
ncbi:MAG: tRNA modification GTPase MnmE [Syntrophaceae bacterium PtaU1.Bin231]|nr:MAG: tRNA modification GTPase MnmE [Syntrophaceae bacterium PtaU1.Bin231]